MKTQIQLSHIFACKMEFGFSHQNVVVIAPNLDKAREILEFYYDEPQIIYLVSCQELIDLLEKLESTQDDFYMVIVMEDLGHTSEFTHHYEWGQSLESLEKGKYAQKDALFLTRDTVQLILEDTLYQFLYEPAIQIDLNATALSYQDKFLKRLTEKKTNKENNNDKLVVADNTHSTTHVGSPNAENSKKIKILISDEFEI